MKYTTTCLSAVPLARSSNWPRLAVAATALLLAGTALAGSDDRDGRDRAIDSRLQTELRRAGLSGKVESTLESRLGRRLDPRLADLGRALFFDTLGGLHDDNACGGCHAPQNGFGDSQSIAIGIQSNRIVGPGRSGPRNQRRSPTPVNAAFYPKLMLNGRFFAPGGDPFSNSLGFSFTPPEGTITFLPHDPKVPQLLVAHAHIPPTETVEVAGFTGTRGTISPRFDAFDDGLGSRVPAPDASGFRNEPIRQAVLARLSGTPAYKQRFGEVFPEVAAGTPIDFTMFGRAIAEFEFTLVRANAPVDRYARGDLGALSGAEKRGALVFLGKGKCVACHAVAGNANEMFSDFENRNIAVPQVAPAFGVGKGNVVFDGAGENEDFGAEQVSGNPADRYKFRTSPLRNVALQPTFFHNGAYTRLEDAIRHHLDVPRAVRQYSTARAGVARDLSFQPATMEAVLARLDPLLAQPISLDGDEFEDLVAFVRNGLLDPRASAKAFCRLIPQTVPSGRAPLSFQGC